MFVIGAFVFVLSRLELLLGNHLSTIPQRGRGIIAYTDVFSVWILVLETTHLFKHSF